MRAELGLPSVKGDDEHGGGMTGGFGGSMGGAGQGGKGKRPISVKFEIPYFTTSGIQVRYLKIIEPKVRALSISSLLAPYCVGVPWRAGLAASALARASPNLALRGSLRSFLSLAGGLRAFRCKEASVWFRERNVGRWSTL